MIILVDAEKTFEKIQHPCMIKTLNKMSMEGKYLNIIKGVYDKPTANIILSGEKLKAIPLTTETRQGCIPMFIAALFTIAKAWKQSRYPSRDEWIKKTWYIYTMQYYLAIKSDEIQLFVTTWMELGGIKLSEISQRETVKYLIILLISRR
uniref:Reverse transcriptase domain-containing protein n=1 Tax=Equus caballus TaxID=9796 RepID=A0A9L0SKL9_HORSE